ncbi:uncharacterized protein L3040_006347 [Drepanopeziza brunnea f. sp. 'multigermtubi']|uniref:uncharacterized protein n=1 Tax=Drepanopeziza brunnea f. sp. 'multigermtubi' TaxID=698441 RepID=UPI002394C2A1|nr:hypothetical protein L3040_006347 [Drepanopeziza brunnea f. sp. 'multigermtubi']
MRMCGSSKKTALDDDDGPVITNLASVMGTMNINGKFKSCCQKKPARNQSPSEDSSFHKRISRRAQKYKTRAVAAQDAMKAKRGHKKPVPFSTESVNLDAEVAAPVPDPNDESIRADSIVSSEVESETAAANTEDQNHAALREECELLRAQALECIRADSIVELEVESETAAVNTEDQNHAALREECEPLRAQALESIHADSIVSSGVESETAAVNAEDENHAALRKECELLRAQAVTLKNAILSRRPKQVGITETAVTKEYEFICEAVEGWVATRLGEALEDNTLYENRDTLSPDAAKLLLSFISNDGKKAFVHAGTDEYNIIAAIMTFLHQEVFNKALCGAVDYRIIELINAVGKSMRNMQPQRGEVTCRTWYTEALAALANEAEFPTLQDRRVDDLAIHLSQVLHMFLPQRTSKKELYISLRNSIIRPSVSLGHKMCLSIDKLALEWASPEELALDTRSGWDNGLPNLILANAAADGQVLKSMPEAELDFLLNVSPALVVRAAREEVFVEPRVLRKPKLLVTTAATRKRKVLHDVLKRRPWESPTLLYWLSDFIEKQSK